MIFSLGEKIRQTMSYDPEPWAAGEESNVSDEGSSKGGGRRERRKARAREERKNELRAGDDVEDLTAAKDAPGRCRGQQRLRGACRAATLISKSGKQTDGEPGVELEAADKI